MREAEQEVERWGEAFKKRGMPCCEVSTKRRRK
jgi:hypothetical protein